MIRIRRIASLTVLCVAAALTSVLSTSPSSAWAEAIVPLSLSGAHEIVVDDAHGHVFISGGASNAVLVTNLSGVPVKTFSGLSTPRDMVLSGDSSTLFVGLSNEIMAVDTVTLTELDRWAVSCFEELAYTAAKVWFVQGCSPGKSVGSLDPATGTVLLDRYDTGSGPLLALPNRPDRLVTMPGGGVFVLDVTTQPTEVGAWNADGACIAGALVRGADEIVRACLQTAASLHRTIDGVRLRYLGTPRCSQDVAATADGRFVAVAIVDDECQPEQQPDDLYIFDLDAPDEPIGVASIGDSGHSLLPGTLAWSSATGRMFAASIDANGKVYLHVLADATKRLAVIDVVAPATMAVFTPTQISGRLANVGAGISGAQLSVTRSGGGGTVTLPDVTTNADGTFAFNDTPGAFGRYTYSIDYPGNATYSSATAQFQVVARAIPWDVNGDGHADLVAGAVGEDLNTIRDAGIVHVLAGSATGVTATGSRTYTQDTVGVPDVAQSGDQLGYAETSGDFNGDGYADVTVSANAEDLGTVRDSGLVHVFYGSANGLRTDNSRTFSLSNTVYGPRSGAFFGDSVAAGDFNGDGRSDLAIGAPGFGRVFVVKGSAGGLGSFLSVFSQDSTGVPGVHRSNDLFGFALATGDINQDGRDDLAIGAPWDWEDRGWSTGSATVLYGASGGLSGSGAQRWTKDSSGIAGAPASFNQDMSDSFGYQLAVADLDGDGYADLAAAAPGAPIFTSTTRQDGGTVTVIYGSVAKLTSAGNKQVSQATAGIPDGPETGDLFGITLASGDANGDRRLELAIATAGDETVTVIRGAGRAATIAGAVAWSQNSTGVAGTTESEDGFGASLRFATFKGGLYAGLAIGIPGEDGGEGAIEVLHSGSGGLTASGSQYFTQDTAGVADVAQAGDWFGTFY